MWRPLLLLVALCLPLREAGASGSSSASETRPSLRVVAETPSIAFTTTEEEAAFHGGWRAHNPAKVVWIADTLTAAIASWPRRDRRLLAPYSADLPTCFAWAGPGESGSLGGVPPGAPVVVSSPLRVPPGRAPEAMVVLELASRSPPTRERAAAVLGRLEQALVEADARGE